MQHLKSAKMIESSFDLLVALKKLDLLKGLPSWWWKGYGRFEVVLGSILTQNTQWSNVIKMLDSMRGANLLSEDCEQSLESVAKADMLVLQSHIFGLQRQKSRYISLIANNILNDFGSFANFKAQVEFEWLIVQKGIGRESAYSILNYACLKEYMVVDSYTHKLLSKLGIEISDYEELRSFCENGVRDNLKGVYKLYPQSMSLAQIFARFHGKIVEFGKMKGDVGKLKTNTL